MVNEDTFFVSEAEYAATMVEIAPVTDDSCRLVYAIPLNRTGALVYMTLYVSKGDSLLLILPDGQIFNGQVSCITPNAITLGSDE